MNEKYTIFYVHVRMSVLGDKVRVSYHLCLHHTLDKVLELHQFSENTHCCIVHMRIGSVMTLSFGNMCFLEKDVFIF